MDYLSLFSLSLGLGPSPILTLLYVSYELILTHPSCLPSSVSRFIYSRFPFPSITFIPPTSLADSVLYQTNQHERERNFYEYPTIETRWRRMCFLFFPRSFACLLAFWTMGGRREDKIKTFDDTRYEFLWSGFGRKIATRLFLLVLQSSRCAKDFVKVLGSDPKSSNTTGRSPSPSRYPTEEEKKRPNAEAKRISSRRRRDIHDSQARRKEENSPLPSYRAKISFRGLYSLTPRTPVRSRSTSLPPKRAPCRTAVTSDRSRLGGPRRDSSLSKILNRWSRSRCASQVGRFPVPSRFRRRGQRIASARRRMEKSVVFERRNETGRMGKVERKYRFVYRHERAKNKKKGRKRKLTSVLRHREREPVPSVSPLVRLQELCTRGRVHEGEPVVNPSDVRYLETEFLLKKEETTTSVCVLGREVAVVNVSRGDGGF